MSSAAERALLHEVSHNGIVRFVELERLWRFALPQSAKDVTHIGGGSDGIVALLPEELLLEEPQALPGLRQEAAEAQARLGRAKASLKKKQAARAATIKGMAARVKPPLETRWVPRFRSPTLDT